jgi:hypothetical protein
MGDYENIKESEIVSRLQEVVWVLYLLRERWDLGEFQKQCTIYMATPLVYGAATYRLHE